MSQFNKKLDEAKSRQKRLYFVGGAALAAIVLILASLVVISRGTRVEIVPEEAKRRAEIRVVEGLGFCIGETVYSLAGNPVISASAPGFKTAVETIGSVHLGKLFSLELLELPGHLVIELVAKKEGAEKTAWRVNGMDTDISKRLDLELEAGAYTVEIDNPFYQHKELKVDIKRGEQTHHQVDLQPVAGTLEISSIPPGAAVTLDGKEVGLTPLQLERGGGKYSLGIAAENYVDIVEQLAVTRARPEVVRNYRLKLKKAKLTLSLMPEDGTLLVNGIQRAEPLLLDATVEHRLTYMKAGYYTEKQTVRLAADEQRHISFQLKHETGAVEISSSPPAQIWIGNKDYGAGPVSANLPAVPHKITFKKPGYRSASTVVKPKGGTVQKVSVTLLTENQARLREAPREFTNQAGIKLKLFVVRDTFTMGAPRSEKGQRANEFERKISLTKPFYASLFEITNEQFAKFEPKQAAGTPGSPVTSIAWQDAAAFCNWLSAKENLLPFYKTADGEVTGFSPHSDGYRLLSEGEWEWLARKSGKPQQTIFVWGNETIVPPGAANVADESAKGRVRFYIPHYNDGYPGIAPAGSLNTESAGLYDMGGNVSEWVHDVYSIVPPAAGTISSNPLGEQRGDAHVVKGANFRSGTLTTLRPAFREGLTGGRDDVGFRIGRYLYGKQDE